MDARDAFLRAAGTLISVFLQLCDYRIVGNVARICVIDVAVCNRDLYKKVELPVVAELKRVTPEAFGYFRAVFEESSMVLAFSWLESFLGEAEEALYLTNPANLGENVQVKLGKILDVSSVEELLYDIVRRRVRERSQWSLGNRLKDLRDHDGFSFKVEDKDVQWISDSRNAIIHNRRVGMFRVKRKRVTYEALPGKHSFTQEDAERFLGITANLIVDLYQGTCRALKISSRSRLHRSNGGMLNLWRYMWSSGDRKPDGEAPRMPETGGHETE